MLKCCLPDKLLNHLLDGQGIRQADVREADVRDARTNTQLVPGIRAHTHIRIHTHKHTHTSAHTHTHSIIRCKDIHANTHTHTRTHKHILMDLKIM